MNVTGPAGKTILRYIINNDSSGMPAALAQELSLLAVDDDDTSLKQWCEEAIQALPAEVTAIRRGNVNVINKVLGRVMKLSRGTTDAKTAKAMLENILLSK